MGRDAPHPIRKALVQYLVAPAARLPVSAHRRRSGAGTSPDPSGASLLGALSESYGCPRSMVRFPPMDAMYAFFQPVSHVPDYPGGNPNSGRPSAPVLERGLHTGHGVVSFSAPRSSRPDLDGQG